MTIDKLNSNMLDESLNLSSKTVILPESSVTTHVTSFNDSSIRADILKLALHQAIDGNRVAYNLEDSFVDGFEDDSGITTETTVDRDATGEYVNTIVGTAIDSNTLLLVQSNTTTDGSTTFTDDSSSGRTVTVNGNTQHDTAIKKTGTSSMLFDGTGDSLTVPNSLDWKFAGDFTYECWIRTTGTTRDNFIIKGVDGSWGSIEWNLRMNGSSYVAEGQISNNGSTGISLTGSTAVNDGVWHHLAIVRSGNQFDLYVDGTSESSVTSSLTIRNGTSFPLAIGAEGDGTNEMTGNIDFVRVSNVARYSSSFTPTTEVLGQTASATGTLISDPQTASTSRTSASGVIIYEDQAGTNTLGTDLKIYFSCDNSTWTEASSYGTATTYSGTKKLVKLGATNCTAGTSVAMKAEWAGQSASTGTEKVITAVGDAHHDNGQAKFGTTSLYCDGTDDEISISDSSEFAFSGDYTVEFWVYFNGTPANNTHICGQGTSTTATYAFMFRCDSSGNFLASTSNGSTARNITSSTNMSNGWHHVAMVKNGTSQKLYIDGTQEGSTVTHSDPVQNVAYPWEFGGGNNSASHINAWFDEIRFSDNARYNANFTPSTTVFTEDANTVLLIHCDGSDGSTTFVDSSVVTGKEARLHGWAVNY